MTLLSQGILTDLTFQQICDQCEKESEIPFFVSYCSRTSCDFCLDCRAWYGAISKSVDPTGLPVNKRSIRAKLFLRKVLRSWTVYANAASATPKQVEQRACYTRSSLV